MRTAEALGLVGAVGHRSLDLGTERRNDKTIPICSMYGIFTYIWVISKVNVGKYSIHGAYGITKSTDNLVN